MFIWKNLKIHWGMGIDIFPLIGIYKNPCLAKIQNKIFLLNRALLSKDLALATHDNTWMSSNLLRVLYRLPRRIRHLICEISEFFVFKSFKGSEQIAVVWQNLDLRYEKNIFLPVTKLEFENRNFTSPLNYDYVLTHLYGDYMTPPPIAERNGHEGIMGKIIYDLKQDYSYYQNGLE